MIKLKDLMAVADSDIHIMVNGRYNVNKLILRQDYICCCPDFISQQLMDTEIARLCGGADNALKVWLKETNDAQDN